MLNPPPILYLLSSLHTESQRQESEQATNLNASRSLLVFRFYENKPQRPFVLEAFISGEGSQDISIEMDPRTQKLFLPDGELVNCAYPIVWVACPCRNPHPTDAKSHISRFRFSRRFLVFRVNEGEDENVAWRELEGRTKEAKK